MTPNEIQLNAEIIRVTKANDALRAERDALVRKLEALQADSENEQTEWYKLMLKAQGERDALAAALREIADVMPAHDGYDPSRAVIRLQILARAALVKGVRS